MSRSGSKAERLGLGLFALGVFASLGLLVHPWYDSRYGDAGVYVATARAIAAGDGYTYLGAPLIAHPPGFSLLIAPVVAALGTHFYALNLYVSLFGAAGVVLLALHQRARVGWILALLTALALWLNPGYQRLCNQVMSDVPGTTLLLVCLLVERWAARAPSWRRELVLGLCIGLSAHVRSLQLLLVPAIAVARLLQRRRAGGAVASWRSFALRRLALFAAVAGLLVLPWSIRSAYVAPPAPADQTLVHSYSSAMWHRDPADPDSPRFSAREILSRIPANSALIANVLGSRMQRGLGYPKAPTAAVGILLVASSLAVLWRRRAPAELFVAGSLLVLVFYFDLRDRLLLPLYALSFAAAVDVARELLARVAGARAAGIGVTGALTLLIVLDFQPRWGWEGIEKRHRVYESIASAIDSELDPDACIGAGIGFHYGVYLERPVYSLWFATRRDDRPEVAEAVIDKYGLNTLVLSPLIGVEMAMLPYFEQRYGEARGAGRAFVVRVRLRGLQPCGGSRR
jgi:hypothetical protein